MFESEPVSAQYYRRYDDEMPQHYRGGDRSVPQYSSSISTDGSKDLSSDEMQNIYQNSTLTEEVQKQLINDVYICLCEDICTVAS